MITFDPPLIRGLALSRYKRFIVKVELPSEEIVDAYCPNTGPMTGVWAENRFCWIQPRSGSGKMLYTMRLMETDNTLVGIDTQLPNTLIHQALTKRKPEWLMEMLPKFNDFSAEVTIEPSWRVDFLLKTSDKSIPLEVKNVLWKPQKNVVAFPDTVTTRGQKHMSRLTEFAKKNDTIGIVLYVVQRSDCEHFAVSRQKDRQYWEYWQNNKYIKSVIVSCDVHTSHIGLHEALSLIEDINI